MVNSYGNDLTTKKLEEYIEFTFNNNDFSKYLLEVINEILVNDYEIYLDKIKI